MTGPCTFPGCGKPIASVGLCSGHEAQKRRGHELRPLRLRRPKTDTRCLIEGCEKPRGPGRYCEMHRARIKRHGDPDRVILPGDRALPTGPAHPHWKEAPESYGYVHKKLRKQYGSARNYPCACGDAADQWAYVGPRTPDDRMPFGLLEQYEPACFSCHAEFDHIQRTGEAS